ncbi:hypothetical protein K466DRAFT_566850 [Polyporus arcularius HHB13444]|uniref:Cyclin N-terminal domain-containing protein n=1 Tax=Polyporus arcularius HHB13444 TaxID=1314778 RepID=A0A5C3P5W7_9APHY|nr:hypothetical protein K466DRAFT_566850 [Polyporus arcularius HHB13444]
MSSTVPTDPRLMQMFRTPMSEAVVDYFVDKVTTTVARTTIAQPYKAAFELKTYHLMYFVHNMIVSAGLDMQVVLTAIVYLDRMRVEELWAYGDEYICERLTVGALKLAQKWLYDERHHHTKWTHSSHFSRQDVDIMERHFLRMIDYNCWASPGAYLEHHAPLMRYVSRLNTIHARTQRASIFPPRKPEEPRIFLPEPKPELQPVSVSIPEPAQASHSAADLPDLMYPEPSLASPMSMSEDEYDAIFSSDDESSDESPEAITPPDAARHAQPAAAHASASATGTDTHAATQAAADQQADVDELYLQEVRDAEMQARIRFYAADHGTVLYPCGTPQFVPPSPSPSNLQHYERRGSDPVLLATRAHVPAVKQGQREGGGYGHAQPWHQMQAWRSAGLSGNTTWGTLGLFVS